MTPVVLPALRRVDGIWILGWVIHFTPTDPETSPMIFRRDLDKAIRLAARIARRQQRDREWAAEALGACGA